MLNQIYHMIATGKNVMFFQFQFNHVIITFIKRDFY